jgi:hypothetical protein
MTPTLLGIVLAASLTGTGGVVAKYILRNRNQERPEHVVHVEHSLEDFIGDIVQEHIQRKSEDSDTEIKINIHTHYNKEKDNV